MDILNSLWTAFAETLMKVLPVSPFQEYIIYFKSLPFLGYLNWFFPVGDCLVIMSTWLVAVGLFYLYSIVMRWVKLIGD